MPPLLPIADSSSEFSSDSDSTLLDTESEAGSVTAAPRQPPHVTFLCIIIPHQSEPEIQLLVAALLDLSEELVRAPPRRTL